VKRLVALVDGHVQGVGFRWWVRGEATELGLAGSAENLTDGRVRVVLEGPDDTVGEMLARLEEQPSAYRRPGRVDSVTHEWEQLAEGQGFTVY